MAGEPDSTRLGKLIEAEIAELEGLRDSTSGSRDTVALDQQSVGRLSRVDAMQRQAMAQASDRRRAARLVALRQALTRIADGEFGYCENCGDPIAQGRLEIDPAAFHCVACAKAAGS